MRTCRTMGRLVGARFNATAAAVGIPAAAVDKASAPYLVWTDVNVLGRKRLEKVTTTCDGKTNYCSLRTSMKAPAAAAAIKQSVPQAKSLADVAAAMEAALFRVRQLEAERAALQLSVWGLKDQINLGLNVHAADKIDGFKKELVVAEQQLATNRKAHAEYCAKTFDTATFNDVINMFRIAGERCPHARNYAEVLLDDMTLASTAFDESTKMMLKNVVFGDLPHEDSNLLFSFVENPERGEVSLAPIKDGDLTAVADEAVMTIGHRHTTPVTEHTKLQQKDTHPMLQRSPE